MAIALATVIRDMGLPSPGGVFAMSPWVDLTHSQESYFRNNDTDGIPKAPPKDPRLGERIHYYTENQYLKDGYVSPFFQENLQNLPPMLIQCGSAEKLCDEAVLFAERLSRADGENNVLLEVYQAHVHCFQLFNWFKGSKNAICRAGVWIHNIVNNVTPQKSAQVFLDFRGIEYGRTLLLKAERLSLIIPQIHSQCSVFRKTPSFAILQKEPSQDRKISNSGSFISLRPAPTIRKTPTSLMQRESSMLFPSPGNGSFVDPAIELEAQSYSQPHLTDIQK